MTNDDRGRESVELSQEERRALENARLNREPSGDLEARVWTAVDADRRAGGSGPARRALTPVVAVLGTAAALLLGLWLGAAMRRSPAPNAGGGQRFMLLLYEDADYQPAADPAERVREYSFWAAELSKGGALLAGDELDDAGVSMTAGSAGASAVAVAGASSQPRGYFVIVAADEAAAERIAATCPHLKHGGRVVVRRIVT